MIDEEVVEMNEEIKARIKNKEKALENAYKEQNMVENTIKDIEVTIPMFKKEHEISAANAIVVLEGFELLKPNWKYETDPRYIENLKKMTMLNIEKANIMYEQKLKEFANIIERSTQQKEQIAPYIESLKKEIEDLKVELEE